MIGQDLPVCCGHPSILTEEEFTALLGKLATLFVCIGNRDLPSVVEAKKGPEGQVPVRITASDIYCNGTIRHIRCSLLSNKPRCDICRIHRSDLMVLARREMRKSESVFSLESAIPNKRLSHQQLQEKVSLLQADRRGLKRRSLALQERVESMMKVENVAVSGVQHDQFQVMMSENDEEMGKLLGLSATAKLLWEQQMCWHPAIIRWCIALQSKASAGYNLLRQSGFMKLTHQALSTITVTSQIPPQV